MVLAYQTDEHDAALHDDRLLSDASRYLTGHELRGTAQLAVNAWTHLAVTYDGSQGTPNPFTDVQLTAQVTAPSGRKVTVDGFFDGGGAIRGLNAGRRELPRSELDGLIEFGSSPRGPTMVGMP